jgi:hypothetical protein
MYGEIESWPSGYSCEMIRSVAKLQVQLGANLSDATGNFNAENVVYSLENYAASCYIQPPSGTLVGKLLPLTPPINYSNSTGDHYFLQRTGSTLYNTTIYMFEFPTSTMSWEGDSFAETAFSRLRRHLLLRKGTQGVDATYYRLDFYDPLTKKFLDIIRNHHYLFTINSIRSEGYQNDWEAQYAPGSNIEYTIEVRDGANHITSNGQYAIVTSVDTAYVEVPANTVKIATVRYQLPPGMLPLTLNYTSNTASVTSTPNSTLILHSPNSTNSLTGTNQDVAVTTSMGFIAGQVIFKYGNITHTMHVKKK